MTGTQLIPIEHIRQAIILLRGQKVILDREIAALYRVPTGMLKRAVRRNADRFPSDFMFVLENEEVAALRCQSGISKSDPRGGVRYAPMAFTEQGGAMLSSVLNSERAIRQLMTPPEPRPSRDCPHVRRPARYRRQDAAGD